MRDYKYIVEEYHPRIEKLYENNKVILSEKLAIDFDKEEPKVINNGECTKLHSKTGVYSLLLILLAQPGKDVSIEEIYEIIWGNKDSEKLNQSLRKVVSDSNIILTENGNQYIQYINTRTVDKSKFLYFELPTEQDKLAQTRSAIFSRFLHIKEVSQDEDGNFIIIWQDNSENQTEKKYKGEIQDGNLHGFGTMTYEDGSKYTGKFVNGYREDENGIMYYNDDDIFECYEGGWERDRWHGKGTLTYKDGGKYVGQFMNNEADGKGKMFFGKKDIYKAYKGEWRHNRWHGKGTLIFKDGTRYRGKFNNYYLDCKKGLAKFGDKEKVYKSYKGEWKNNRWSGQGILTFKDGGKYDGHFDNGTFDGIGKMIYGENEKIYKSYEGDWKNNCWHGEGTLIYKDGTKYIGHFEYNVADGIGEMINVDYRYISYYGEWKNNLPHGHGILTYQNGRIWEGEFSEGKRIIYKKTILKNIRFFGRKK